MMKPLYALFIRDLRIGWRVGGGTLLSLLFFLILVSVTPFAIGPDLNRLSEIAPAILWIGVLLAALLSLDRLLLSDHEDGTLDLLMLSPISPVLIVMTKCLAHWISVGLPVVIFSPLAGLLVNLEQERILILLLSLLLGSPALTFIGVAGAALTVTLRRGGLLVAIIILPFTVPVLIFGVSAASAAATAEQTTGGLLYLAALSLFFLILGPVAAGLAIAKRG